MQLLPHDGNLMDPCCNTIFATLVSQFRANDRLRVRGISSEFYRLLVSVCLLEQTDVLLVVYSIAIAWLRSAGRFCYFIRNANVSFTQEGPLDLEDVDGTPVLWRKSFPMMILMGWDESCRCTRVKENFWKGKPHGSVSRLYRCSRGTIGETTSFHYE